MMFKTSLTNVMGDAIFSTMSAYLVFVILVVTVIYMFRYRKGRLPPGPWGLPFVGYVPFLKAKFCEEFADLAKIYGDVFRLNIYGKNVIVLNSYEAIRECFQSKGDMFSGRDFDRDSFFLWIVDAKGISQDQGDSWREHRRFAKQTLKEYGLGKLAMEERVQEMAQDVLLALENSKGQPYDPLDILANTTLNVILCLAAGRKYSADDAEFKKIRACVRVVLQNVSGLTIFAKPPWKRILGLWKNTDCGLVEVKETLHRVAAEIISQHQATYDETDLRDFTDEFLHKRQEAETEGKSVSSTFTADRLRSILVNFMFAGSETTSNTVYWGIRILTYRPEIQTKIQQELDNVVGRERLPSVQDISKLPYLEAFILELQRFSTIIPLGVPHTNPDPVIVFGFVIPERSMVTANIWAVHNDPKFFPNPEQFDPERFLDPAHREERRKRVIPFLLGKRSCIGEALARMEVFNLLTMILQRFTICHPDGDAGTTGVDESFMRLAPSFKICARPRT